MKTVVIAWGETVRQQALKAVAFLGPLNAPETELWVFGNGIREDQLQDLPFQKVLILEGFGNLYTCTGQYAEELFNLARDGGVRLAVFPDSNQGEELAVRVSLRLGAAAALKIAGIVIMSENIYLERKVCSCNLDGRFRAPRNAFAVTLDKNAVEESRERGRPVIMHRRIQAEHRMEFISCEEKALPVGKCLENAERIVVAGRGAAGSDTLGTLRQIGWELDAGLGATRAAVLEAMLPYSDMIGMTGVITRPELCIAFGASGSTPFMIGVRDSKILVGVNNDPGAPVFKSCDLAVVDDAGRFASAFLEVLREEKGK